MTQQLPEGHPQVRQGKIGVLLVNLGTPDGPDPASVRRYLKEFLSDRRVIELSPLLWQPILRGVILPTRPRRSAEAYAKIWDHERNESPLRAITRQQAEELSAWFATRHEQVVLDWAMRYGSPSIAEKLGTLSEAGCRRLLVMPLYPQYSAATTASVCDEVFAQLARRRWQPALRTLPPYHDEPAYIAALADSLRRAFSEEGEPEVLLASFHGMPRETLDKGDPYHCHCQKTGRLLREALGWNPERLRVTFQSRFGPKEWLRPYSDATVKQLAGEGVKRIAMISPGFSADCLETLEEAAIGLRESFLESGGERFTYVPCLNAGETHIALLAKLAERELRGWL
ncbi:MAG: ferrochelatase [Rhodovibrionaceae bacterium]